MRDHLAILIVMSALFVAINAPNFACVAAPRDEPAYQHAAVAADHPLASQAGVEILRRGGNAVDAAVATSFCLSVVRPYSCGIGGGGFMIVHIPARGEAPAQQFALDYRETSPAAIDRDYYIRLEDEDASRYGVHAVGVPGTVAGLLDALERWGTLDRASVLAPAIRIAREGFPADASHVGAACHLRDLLRDKPGLAPLLGDLWETLYRRGEIEIGDLLRNPAQARALELIATYGELAFYQGEIADAIVRVMENFDGPIDRDDLSECRPQQRTPLRGTFEDYEIVGMPPPSSGGIALNAILGLIDRRYEAWNAPSHNSPAYVHLVAEAMKHAFADRAQWLADASFVEVPVDRLTSDEYLDELARRMEPHCTLDDPFDYGSVTAGAETTMPDGGTSHLSVIDTDGMAVACTETINLISGSLVAVPEFGFFLNNEMNDFTTIPGQPNAFGLRQSDRNLPEPGKRPLSSMSPTIVLRDGRAVVIAGASGGPRIITATAQAILNVLLFEMSPFEAVAAPRFHHQWMPNVLRFESRWRDDSAPEALQERGHEIGPIEEIGVVQMIHVREDGAIRAASDLRKGGRPAGW